MLDIKAGPATPGCKWLTGRLSTDAGSLETAATYIAVEAMRMRCKPTATFDMWNGARLARTRLSTSDSKRIAPFVRTALGLPGAELPADHVQGWVAEVTWYLVLRDHVPGGRRLAYLSPPSFHVTGPGADGLVVYRAATDLVFRLWEIKKYHGAGHVSAAVAQAYGQLNERATEYLAQLTALADSHTGPLGETFAALVDLWVDADARAGAGVAVSTSNDKHPRRCFSTMLDNFPDFAIDGQLEGLVVGLGELPTFALDVRGVVWSVL
jgi:hypothetical protein